MFSRTKFQLNYSFHDLGKSQKQLFHLWVIGRAQTSRRVPSIHVLVCFHKINMYKRTPR
jgi:hypothetical protein